MAENQTESSQPGNQELPTPEFSESGVSSTSGGADEIVSKLTPVIEQIVQRTVQSTKDKRISKIEKALGGRLDVLAELEEQGVSIPKDVQTAMQIRELQERINQSSAQPAPVSDNGLSRPKAAATEAIATLQEYELSENDPAFLEILRGRYANRAEFDLKVMGHIAAKLKPQKPANVADVVQAPAATRTTEKGNDALLVEYQKEMLAARGNKALGKGIMKKYRDLGAPIERVHFTV